MAIDLDSSPVTIIPGITGLMNSRRPLGGLELSALPYLSEWETAMQTKGLETAAVYNPANYTPPNPSYGTSYQYDSAWCLFQIGDWLNDTTTWDVYGHWAVDSERTAYWLPNSYSIPPWLRAPHGMLEDMSRGGGVVTLADIESMRDSPTYSSASICNRYYEYDFPHARMEALSREVGYAMQCNIIAERAGSARVTESNDPSTPDDESTMPRVGWFIGFMEAHLEQWRTQTFLAPPENNPRLAPFMVALTACSLIDWTIWEEENSRNPNAYWPTGNWPNILACLDDVFTWMRDTATVVSGAYEGQRLYRELAIGSSGDFYGFAYQDRDDVNGTGAVTHGLNCLIAPVYYWLYMKTGNLTHRQTGDDLYSGAYVQGDWTYIGKRFNQHFRRWFQGVNWRAAGDTAWYGS